MSLLERLFAHPWAAWVLQWRFVKFGTVGVSGIVINQVLLFLGQEHFFAAIEPPETRLNVSLPVAIFFATINNFAWNRHWTWQDRPRDESKSILAQFGQYTLACWLGILLQVIFTKWLVLYFHYLIANLIAIVIASVFNYLVNHFWTFRHQKINPENRGQTTILWGSKSWSVPYFLAMLLAVFVYGYGLDSLYIPKNGDENPYAHITHQTAASGHWLPLQSELADMRNTKPPLLFWQGIVSTHGGQDWTLWNLRYPSVIYTLLTAAMIFLLGWKISSRNVSRGLLAALAFLAFFSTYRYGRPFLTNAPETFWLFLPFFILLYWRETAFASRALPFLLGGVIGIGLLYKSFALLLPVGLGLSWWYLHQRNYKFAAFLLSDVWKLIVIAVISLAIFGLWFLLDPDPQAVWREFVMKENAGKFEAGGGSYAAKLLWGSSSVWTMLLGLPLNAGLLAVPVAALMIEALCYRTQLSRDEKLLWIWVLVMLLVFTLPSQRSSRYLLAAMPALAVLCALGWERLRSRWFVIALIVCELALLGLAYLAIRMQSAGGFYPAIYWLLLLATAGFAMMAMVLPELTRPGLAVTSLLVCLSLAGFLRPFDGPHGRFGAEALQQVAGREVHVPSDFNAKYEDYRFLLPGANIREYRETREQNVGDMARQYPLFTVRLPLDGHACTGCRVLAERLDLRSRHTPQELNEILHGRVFENMVLKEMLLESPASAP